MSKELKEFLGFMLVGLLFAIAAAIGACAK